MQTRLARFSSAEAINRKGYRTKSYVSRRGRTQGGKLFGDMAIQRILTNSFFIGKVRHKDQLHEGRHEPIVSVKMFEQVQRLLASNRGARNRAQNFHLFTLEGLVRCGECGSFMTPYYGYGKQGRPYFYYVCTNRNHRGPEACSMANVPAAPLEQVIADRLIQLSKNDRTIDRLVREAMADTSELLGNFEKRRITLNTNRRRVQDQIDSLVEAIADRKTGLKSVGQKIVELEEQKEQFDDEILELDLDIEAAKKKAASAQSLTDSLTTFDDLYRDAIPEERRELIRLRVNQLVWTPDEIRLALLDHPQDVSRVQRDVTTGSPDYALTEPLLIWDKFEVYQVHRRHLPFISKPPHGKEKAPG